MLNVIDIFWGDSRCTYSYLALPELPAPYLIPGRDLPDAVLGEWISCRYASKVLSAKID